MPTNQLMYSCFELLADGSHGSPLQIHCERIQRPDHPEIIQDIYALVQPAIRLSRFDGEHYGEVDGGPRRFFSMDPLQPQFEPGAKQG